MSDIPNGKHHPDDESAREHAEAAREHAQSAGSHAAAAAAEVRDAAREAAREIGERVGSMADELRAKAKGWQGDVEHYIRENPTKSVLTAAGLGFVLGMIFRR
jgi:ElaB/YqjD/DUF883 family membrane-anchored ribosome-binding protein